MSQPLLTCSACGGLSPASRSLCVHCDERITAPRFAQLRTLGRVLAAGGALVTLMACYGMAARRGDMHAGAACLSDNDRDTVCAPQDCDDARADVYPGAADPDQDGVDQNCDGVDGWRDRAEVAVDPPAPQSL
jgi:hypothetical protein